jgi:hypothetical protein
MSDDMGSILTMAGILVVGYLAYRLLTKDKTNTELYPGEAKDEAATPGGTPAPTAGKCTGGKVLCKDQKCESQAECNKEGKCKSGENWDGDLQKCVASSAFARINRRGGRIII